MVVQLFSIWIKLKFSPKHHPNTTTALMTAKYSTHATQMAKNNIISYRQLINVTTRQRQVINISRDMLRLARCHLQTLMRKRNKCLLSIIDFVWKELFTYVNRVFGNNKIIKVDKIRYPWNRIILYRHEM